MIKILHNNACSKSKAILEHLDENNVKFEIIDMIQNPLSEMELKTVLKKLNCEPLEMLRRNDPEFKKLDINEDDFSTDDLISFLAKNPKLIQRPILIKDKIAMIGRPIENIRFFLED